MNIVEILDYGNNIATGMKAVAHTEEEKRFARSWKEFIEFTARSGINPNHLCMCWDIEEGNLANSGSNESGSLNTRIYFARACAELDFPAQETAKQDGLTACLTLISRFYKDRRESNTLAVNINISDKPFEFMSGELNDLYGAVMEINFRKGLLVAYNTADWL